MEKFTHFNEQGLPCMVNVSEKESTLRQAIASGKVYAHKETIKKIRENALKKGDVLSTAQIAGIMAAKNTSSMIPMCHPILLTGVDMQFSLREEEGLIHIQATVSCKGSTGVEMEALSAVSVAALTIYDMCKAVQKDMAIGDIHLDRKSGGKSGDFTYQGKEILDQRKK